MYRSLLLETVVAEAMQRQTTTVTFYSGSLNDFHPKPLETLQTVAY